MEPTAEVPTQREPLETVRKRRAALHEALVEFETSLAAPAAGREDDWRADVSVALGGLREAFTEHVAVTEGPDGLYADITHDHERLANPVRRLGAEHVSISNDLTEIEALLAGSEASEGVRALATALIGRLAHHRQRGADLVYEAYNVDIGGE